MPIDLRTRTKEEEDKYNQMMKELVIPVQSEWLNKNLTDVSQLDGERQTNEKVCKRLNQIEIK